MKLEKTVILPDGDALTLRSMRREDAQTALKTLRRVAGETLNMMRYPDEWTMTVEQEIERIEKACANPRALELGAFLDGELVGIGGINPISTADRTRHRLGLGISVLKAHWHRGIATAMMETMIDAAHGMDVELIELSAVSENERALELYRRFGFTEYGRYPHALKYRDGSYADFVLMLLDVKRRN
ncbi:MAG: GNAT family N-acetyltransferase [Clostridia bacterium]|nr:GNAT family N-acetyltransferase [Clostridia bacterium]